MSIGRSLPWTRTRGALLVVICRSLPPISIIFFSNSLSVMPAIIRPSSQYGFPQDFLERGLPGGDLDQAAAAQRDHALLKRFLLQFQGRCPHQDELAELIVDLQDFIEPDAPLVPTLVARPTALAVVDRRRLSFLRSESSIQQRLLRNVQRLLAIRADAAH